MQHLAQLDLAHLAMEQPDFAADPAPHFTSARARHPWLAMSVLGPVVTEYRAVRDLLAMDDALRTSFPEMIEMLGAEGTPWGRFQTSHILARIGDDHKRLRDTLAPAFTPRQANRHRPLMREVIADLLDEWAPKGAFDFEQFASWFPITVMCRLIGAPPGAIPRLRDSMEALGLSVSMDPQYLPQLQAATVVLDEFAHELIRERHARGLNTGEDGDLLDLLLEAQERGGMDEREIADILIFLLVAGFDTSKNILTLMMLELVNHPEAYRRCAEDYDWCVRVVDETMRLHGVTNTSRLTTRDIVYRDVLIPAGTMLWFPWSLVGQDPAVTPGADKFDPAREQKNPHVGFALGPHMCIGQFIARAQLAEGLHLIAQRIRNPVSPGPDGWRPFVGVWGVAGLPVEFEPA